MRINNITIKNLKILKNVFIETKNLTLLTGVNSSGKSTFIQSLLLLKQNSNFLNKISLNKMLHKSIKKDENNRDILKYVNNIENIRMNLNGDFIKLGTKKDIFSQDVYKEDIEIELNVENIGNYKVLCNYENLAISIDTDSDIPVEGLINLFANDFQYLNADRIQPNSTYSLSETQILNNLIGIKGEYTAHYLDINRHKKLSIDLLKHPSSKTNHLLENVSLWLNEISEGIEVHAKMYSDIQKVSLSYQYTYGNNTTNEYLPMNVGFGITYVLPIIVSILKSKPNDLLIIENPESHLHPAAQSKIAQLCSLAASAGVQLIVESHSDHFLNGIRIATKKGILNKNDSIIYYFEKNNETISSEIHKLEIDENGKINKKWPKGFFDEYRKQLDELIW